jgi:hypothetical protein
MWPRVREAVGLDGLKRVIWTEGFDGKEWGTRVFVEAPAPRRGVLALLGSQPLGDELLKSIPSTATVAGASRFDLVKFIDEIRTAVGKIDENGVAQFDAALEQASNMLGMDVRKEFLGALGDEWAYYTDPMTGGRGAMGLVMVNRLRDAAKAEQALTRIQSMIDAIVAQQMRQERVRVSFRETKVNGVTLHFAATPFITPTWAVHQGNLYVGLYPQVVAAAASHTSRGGKGLADNKDFAALRQRLLAGAGNNAKAASVGFVDLPTTAPSSYQTWLAISSMARFGDLFGVESPALLFPTMHVLMQHLTPAGSVSWADETGWHLRGVSPFPGSVAFASDSGGMMDAQSTAMIVSVLLPSLNRAREQANRVKSASNLRQIAIGVQMYANDNKGRFPPDFAALAKHGALEPDVFINPRGGNSLPAGLEGDALAAWANSSSDYVYAGAGKNWRTPADVILAYEKPDEMRDGINIAFVDGRVHFVPMEKAKQMIRAGRGRPDDAPAGVGGQ